MAVELSRIVRFCIDLGEIHRPSPASRPSEPPTNSFAGWPTMRGIGVFYELQVTCRGDADPVTGYLLNISDIDEAVRNHALPIVQAAVVESLNGRAIPPQALLPSIVAALQGPLRDCVTSVRWRLSPYYSVAMNADDPGRAVLRQQFEFAAAHRLHVPSLSDQANRQTFGRCNNLNGHGHNYRLEVAVAVALDDAGSNKAALSLTALERIVNETIIKRFDHKHLNLDTSEFANLNPSVEHIAKVCHDLLVQQVTDAGGKLERVTVWETAKTSCSYPG